MLVTGAGGSIGAELCRQIARVGPKLLVLVENSENALFEIRRELEEERHFARAASVLADCKDATRVREVFEEYSPSVVFHAAAYKHVPLMEENPVEAVRNNAVATRIVAAAAGEAGVERFVLVSTDKAVSPSTVMGASKALAEWAVEAAQNRWKGTRYASVRFGNVLGSSGSVVPIFRRQIAKGGPVTVTDSRMTRYFMTIPEAVQLIIRSGELATGGEVFVLEMGDPVKIVDLAANMIRLAGYEPDVDIAIEVVGRRPGEKIHEELFNPGERPQPTPAEKIVYAVQPPLDPEWVESAFARIEELVYAGDASALASAVAELSAERALAGSRRQLTAPGGDARRPAFYSSTLAGDSPGDRRLRRVGLCAGAGGALGPLLLAGPRREAAARVGRACARALGAGAPAVPGRVVAQPQPPARTGDPPPALRRPVPKPARPAPPGAPRPRPRRPGRTAAAAAAAGAGPATAQQDKPVPVPAGQTADAASAGGQRRGEERRAAKAGRGRAATPSDAAAVAARRPAPPASGQQPTTTGGAKPTRSGSALRSPARREPAAAGGAARPPLPAHAPPTASAGTPASSPPRPDGPSRPRHSDRRPAQPATPAGSRGGDVASVPREARFARGRRRLAALARRRRHPAAARKRAADRRSARRYIAIVAGRPARARRRGAPTASPS